MHSGNGEHNRVGGSAAARVALVTCSELPELDRDTQLLIPALEALGVSVTATVWDDPKIDWARFDLAVVRCCWDYVPRRAEFLTWANRLPSLANPAEVLTWNTQKRYLLDLAARGVPILPTTWVPPELQWNPPDDGEWVVKPEVSIASLDTGRYCLSDLEERCLAMDHVRRLHRGGRTAMAQPYLRGVEDEGETSLVYLGGEFSHAMRKGALLKGPDTGLDRRFQEDGGIDLRVRLPTTAQLAVAERALDAVPAGRERLLYARVDLVPGPEGSPLLMELELTEPQLYFNYAPSAAEGFATLIEKRMGGAKRRLNTQGLDEVAPFWKSSE